MKRTFILAGLLFFTLGIASQQAPATLAQEQSASPVEGTDGESLRTTAVINAPEDSPIGRPILLDASSSRTIGSEVRYLWYASESTEPISRTADAIYTPEQAGIIRFRLVLRSKVGGVVEASEAIHEVTVYRRKMVLITDSSTSEESLASHVRIASGAGIYLRTLRFPSTFPVGGERLSRFLAERRDAFQGAEAIILWADAIDGAQSLVNAVRDDPARMREIKDQTIVIVTGRRLSTVAQTVRAPVSVLDPQRTILMHAPQLGTLFSTASVETFIEDAQRQELDVQVLQEPGFPYFTWRVLSLLVDYMLIHGVSTQTVLLLLMLPVIAMILSFLKQVIGVTTFGLFAPSIVALSFLALGWWVGLLFFLFIIAASYMSRALIYRFRILYIPKMAIIITMVSLFLLILLAINSSFGITISRDTVFVLLIMSTLAESFLSAKSEQGLFSMFSGILQTIIAALLCVFIVQWSWFETLILAYPELLLLTILVNLLIGRYTGLRVSEYFRFRELFKHLATEE